MDIPQQDEKKAKLRAIQDLLGVAGDKQPILTITICAGKPRGEGEEGDPLSGLPMMGEPEEEEEELY